LLVYLFSIKIPVSITFVGMKSKAQNSIVFVLAIIAGSVLNGTIVQLGHGVIAPPPGYDFNTEEGLAAGMAFMEPKHFLFPFLAHALGTLLSTSVVTRFAVGGHLRLAMIISAIFFLGGAYMVAILPSPMWFNVVDLSAAYFPMGWLGYRLARKG
jgi:hypothetical protein